MDVKILQDQANIYWERYCESIPKLVKFDCPTIKLNNRIYRTAGRCTPVDNQIEMSAKLMELHYEAMMDEILQHELCHQIDYNLHSKVWNPRNAHSKRWVNIGVIVGVTLKTYHNLEYTK